MLRLSPEQLEQIQRIAEQAYPHECCGILVGRASEDNRTVGRLVAAENRRTDSPANRYLIDPELIRDMEKQLRSSGEEIVGFFHSHPDVPARPSSYDRDHAWPWYSYLIVSVKGGKAGEAASWRLREDRSGFEGEELELVEL